MLRVTVTRENSTDSDPIAEVVIGKFSGSEQRGSYAARIWEPPSRYSNGVDACFAVRGHERYQPAFALVASVLAAWQDGRVDAVGEGVHAALLNASRHPASTETSPTAQRPDPAPHPRIESLRDLMDAIIAGRVTAPSPSALRAAEALLRATDDPALAALGDAVCAVAEPRNAHPATS